MSQIEVVSIEVPNPQASLPQWTEALSTHVGRVTPWVRDEEVTRCVPTSLQDFEGRIEFGALGDGVLSKIAATPNRFSRSLRTRTPTLPVPVLVVVQRCGTIRLDQHDRSCSLRPGDWCLVDSLHPFEGVALGTRTECLVVGLERPSDPELRGLLEQGAGHRWDGKTGMSRVLLSTLGEAFDQLNQFRHASGTSLHKAASAMVWAALREQLEAPSPLSYQDRQRARIKTYIESQLGDPVLSVDAIAQACGMSVRSVHRAFDDDPAGSVSKYIWMRRLSHCADTLRDPRQAHRSITEICYSGGFNSTSHFSRLFKDQFGVCPREYRPASEGAFRVPHAHPRRAGQGLKTAA
jgi:AraC family transcriptional regulator, positive regulator of tynA and feaB